MAETQNDTKKAQDQAGQNQAKEVRQAPVQAGRQQRGEAVDGVTFTTRVPRGVGEPASDAEAQHEGVALTQRSVQKTVDEETEKGYRGQQVSVVPNENYTVAGVTRGAPTPETTVYTPRSR